MDVDLYEDAILDFERAIAAKIGTVANIGKLFVPGGQLATLRSDLISEEACELEDALEAEDLAAVAKECADLLYVTIGTMVAFGIPVWPVFKRVHDNNMAKINGATWNGKKLIKPANHPKTILTDLLP